MSVETAGPPLPVKCLATVSCYQRRSSLLEAASLLYNRGLAAAAAGQHVTVQS